MNSIRPYLPPFEQAAALTPQVVERARIASASLEVDGRRAESRRDFLKLTASALAISAVQPAMGQTSNKGKAPLSFYAQPSSPADSPAASNDVPPYRGQGDVPVLAKGEIPADFWERPRELRLQRGGTFAKIVYYRDGQLVPEGYWQACAMLRDAQVGVMTTMQPTILDVLRGISGFYDAWQWPYPLVITSGFRTAQTNARLYKEGAAKNSLHMYGRAVDLYIPGVSPTYLAALGLHMAQGGVGYYPSKGFTHLDTGTLRVWRG